VASFLQVQFYADRVKLWLQECGDTQDDGGGISIHNIGGVFIVIFVGIYLTFLSLQNITVRTAYKKGHLLMSAAAAAVSF
jgi:hypothetical protein